MYHMWWRTVILLMVHIIKPQHFRDARPIISHYALEASDRSHVCKEDSDCSVVLNLMLFSTLVLMNKLLCCHVAKHNSQG